MSLGLQESHGFLASVAHFCLIIFSLPEAAQRFPRFEGFADFRGMHRRKEWGALGRGAIFAESACSPSLPSSSLQRSLGREGLLIGGQEERGVGFNIQPSPGQSMKPWRSADVLSVYILSLQPHVYSIQASSRGL